MVSHKIKKGVRNPTKIPRYLYKRARDLKTRGRVSFDHRSVTGSQRLPEFSKELYLDAKLLEKVLCDLNADKSLEIGCGFGRLTPWISEHTQDHYAIEPEQKLLKDAKKLNQDVKFDKATAHNIPHPDREFDLIVTWAVLNHVPPEHITESAQEITRVCSGNGTLVVSEKTGDEPNTGRVFTRTIKQYQELFSEFNLVDQYERKIEDFRNQTHAHTLLQFEKS